MKTNEYKIFQEIDEIKTNYETGSSEKIAGLYRSPFKVIKMCEYYSNSRYLKVAVNGEYNKDGLGRDKPFYNVVNFRVALAKTATDLDIKDIQIVSDNPKHQVESMLLNREAYEWMREADFALTLNKMGSTRPKYGGYLLKKTMDDKEMKIEVMDWTKTYTDLTNIMAGPIIEKHNLSPVDIQRKDGVWENVIDVLKANKNLKTKDKTNRIEVYEVTGEFSKATYLNYRGEDFSEEEEFTFSLQKYYIAEVGGKKYKLYGEELSGKMGDYYSYLSWEAQSLDLGRGVIEDTEEAQVWTNDSVINEKNAMDLAGRVGIKTNSKKLSGNILEHDHGKIYELGTNEDINSFNLAPSSLGEYQNQVEKWRAQADNVTSSYNAVTGEQPPSGTPYSQTALLNQVATKPFDYKREEWGIHLTEIFEDWVIPYLVKKIKKEHILVSEFSEDELEMIDEAFAIARSNEDIIGMMLSPEFLQEGVNVTPEMQAGLMEGYKKRIKKLGKKRFLEVPEDFFKDVECKVTVLTTGEQKNKAVVLQSLSELMKTVIGSFNPNTGQFGVLQDPTLSKIFNQIVELSGAGISPISIGKGGMPTQQVAQAPQSPVASPMQSPQLAPM
jgi:hypothetical protein